ncbi:unnamed protein product [Notodromas monacha]|uniref:LIM zinc-binding domain-containing protein n=1 Tax=Notodromas monacha TaxID=399045 RepID=A0A7R9GC89_9CRUS|nr:unnamed protein product [Notodromas monacha]CAG0917224.1 unnamed protein product [Notodromas monacha]
MSAKVKGGKAATTSAAAAAAGGGSSSTGDEKKLLKKERVAPASSRPDPQLTSSGGGKKRRQEARGRRPDDDSFSCALAALCLHGDSKLRDAGMKKMEYKTRQWHEKCFSCCVCKTPIGTKSFIPKDQEIYCTGCYEETFATRCIKCNKFRLC